MGNLTLLEDICVAVECLLIWHWLADVCAQENILVSGQVADSFSLPQYQRSPLSGKQKVNEPQKVPQFKEQNQLCRVAETVTAGRKDLGELVYPIVLSFFSRQVRPLLSVRPLLNILKP